MGPRVRDLVVLSLITISLLGGCSPRQMDEQHFVEYRYAVTEISEIQVELHTGRINVVGGDNQELLLNATLANPSSLIAEQRGSNLFVSLVDPVGDDKLTLQVPAGMALKIDTFTADVSLSNVPGKIEVSSVAGNIEVDTFTGNALLWAGRGDVEVLHGGGELVVIGEHGVLSVDEFDGNLLMTTIMGTINYLAAAGAHGTVFLESDHGPVEVLLPESANLDIWVNTTSGYVTCLGPKLDQTVDGCVGVIGQGMGELVVRTVSGRVDLKVIFTEPEGQND